MRSRQERRKGTKNGHLSLRIRERPTRLKRKNSYQVREGAAGTLRESKKRSAEIRGGREGSVPSAEEGITRAARWEGPRKCDMTLRQGIELARG